MPTSNVLWTEFTVTGLKQVEKLYMFNSGNVCLTRKMFDSENVRL